jgi:hypothetical protein
MVEHLLLRIQLRRKRSSHQNTFARVRVRQHTRMDIVSSRPLAQPMNDETLIRRPNAAFTGCVKAHEQLRSSCMVPYFKPWKFRCCPHSFSMCIVYLLREKCFRITDYTNCALSCVPYVNLWRSLGQWGNGEITGQCEISRPTQGTCAPYSYPLTSVLVAMIPHQLSTTLQFSKVEENCRVSFESCIYFTSSH